MNLSTLLQHVIKSRHFSSGASSTSQKVRVGALGLGYAGGEAILCHCESRFGDEISCLKALGNWEELAALTTLQAAFGRIKKSIISLRPAVPV
ncbi:hypothetical protein GQ457_14G008550 [Hibiscus cannabinus]